MEVWYIEVFLFFFLVNLKLGKEDCQDQVSLSFKSFVHTRLKAATDYQELLFHLKVLLAMMSVVLVMLVTWFAMGNKGITW